jgi:hypothetical protein
LVGGSEALVPEEFPESNREQKARQCENASHRASAMDAAVHTFLASLPLLVFVHNLCLPLAKAYLSIF